MCLNGDKCSILDKIYDSGNEYSSIPFFALLKNKSIILLSKNNGISLWLSRYLVAHSLVLFDTMYRLGTIDVLRVIHPRICFRLKSLNEYPKNNTVLMTICFLRNFQLEGNYHCNLYNPIL